MEEKCETQIVGIFLTSSLSSLILLLMLQVFITYKCGFVVVVETKLQQPHTFDMQFTVGIDQLINLSCEV